MTGAILPRRGLIFILVSPSGAGKSTLSRLLLQEEPRMAMSVSVTTRKKRSNEVHGVHYHFIDQKRFAQMREREELLEWAEVHGNFYGTPREPVEQALAEGRDILFDIDVQGTLELYKTMRADMVAVFILPPTINEQISRLRRRATDDEAAILKRLTTARQELTLWHEFDYVVVNDDLDRAYSEIRAILQAERLKRQGKQAGDVIAQLAADLDTVLKAGKLPR
jgi:guanylate kinase